MDAVPISPLIVTRFAVRISQVGEEPSFDWVRHRASLLRQITYPPLTRTGLDRIPWALLVSPHQEDTVAQELDSIVSSHIGGLDARIVTVIGSPGKRQATQNLFELFEINAPRVLSIRLDSDDVLMPHALPNLLKVAARERTETLFDMYAGYQLVLETKEMVTNARGVQGPFLAVLHGRNCNPLHGIEFHGPARHGRPVVFVHGRNWIQVIHEANVQNRLRQHSWRGRLLAPIAHWHGGGLRRKLALAAWGRQVPVVTAENIMRTCGIETRQTGSMHDTG